MAATLATVAPQADDIDVGTELDAMPVVNPITVSMALAIGFLVVLLGVVAVRPTDAREQQAADEGRPVAAALVRTGGTIGP